MSRVKTEADEKKEKEAMYHMVTFGLNQKNWRQKGVPCIPSPFQLLILKNRMKNIHGVFI